MHFTRGTLFRDSLDPDPVAFCGTLLPWCWMIEDGCQPPPSHDPARLPLGDDLRIGVALSLSSATAIGLSLGPALVDRLAVLGPSLGPLAGLALHELIVNAIIHGNLHVESACSTQWQDIADHQAAIAASLADPLLAGGAITIALGWRPDEVVALIADEGAGYHITAERASSRGSGRGLRLARLVGRVDVLCGGRQTIITMGCSPMPKGDPS